MDLIRIKIRYFAVLRDRAGVEEEDLEVKRCTAAELIEQLISSRTLGLTPALIRPAINGRFVPENTEVQDGDEIVLIPPVAGG